VEAARVSGEGRVRIILVEVLPNLVPIVAASFLFTALYAIGAYVAIAFLGLAGSPTSSPPGLWHWGDVLRAGFANNAVRGGWGRASSRSSRSGGFAWTTATATRRSTPSSTATWCFGGAACWVSPARAAAARQPWRWPPFACFAPLESSRAERCCFTPGRPAET